MGMMKSIFIVLVVVVVVGVGGYFGYNAAFAMGEEAGYDTGYTEGEETGYSSGKLDGYEEGYSSGEQDGYDTGYSTGIDEGYSSGRDDGYDEGYSVGKTDGYTSGKEVGYTQGYDNGIEAGLGHGYTIKDTTYAEVLAFLRKDKTDENEYDESDYGVYVCSHFARDLCNNAEQEGLRCAFVEVRYPAQGHAVVAFNTIDNGLVYFEPQSDERARPVIGKRYYQCIEAAPGTYYIPPSYDDTIKDILVIW